MLQCKSTHIHFSLHLTETTSLSQFLLVLQPTTTNFGPDSVLIALIHLQLRIRLYHADLLTLETQKHNYFATSTNVLCTMQSIVEEKSSYLLHVCQNYFTRLFIYCDIYMISFLMLLFLLYLLNSTLNSHSRILLIIRNATPQNG